MVELAGGLAPEPGATEHWYELSEARGFAGYGLTRALRMLLDVLEGLNALHDTHGVNAEPFVHGELAPALLRVDEQGVTRLIPLAPRHLAPNAPPAAELLGHLAPERLLGDALDPRADVFSAGVLLWEALAGGRLFDGLTVDAIVTRLMGGKVTLPKLPPELGWAVPLKAIALRALSVDPDQRFGSIAELAEAVEVAASGHVASHTDVAAYFGAATRASSMDSRLSAPTHNSSLSALVAPVQASAPIATEPMPVSPPRSSRNAWALGLVLSVFAGLALTPVARNAWRAAHQPVRAVPASTAALALPSAAIAHPAPAPATPEPTLATPEPISVPEVAPAPSGKASRKKTAPKAGKSLSAPMPPKPKLPAKAGRGRDKEAELYGI